MGVCISSSHLHTFSSSHLLIFTSSLSLTSLIFKSFIFTSPLLSHPSHLHISHLHISLFSSSHRLLLSSHLLIFTSAHLHILVPAGSHETLTSSPLRSKWGSILLFLSLEVFIALLYLSRSNPFARNEGRSAKTEVKLRFYLSWSNPFAPNEGRPTIKNCGKIASLLAPEQPFRTKEMRVDRRKLRKNCEFTCLRSNPFARNEGRSSKTEEKLRFYLAPSNPFARNEGRSSKTEEKLRFYVSVCKSVCV